MMLGPFLAALLFPAISIGATVGQSSVSSPALAQPTQCAPVDARKKTLRIKGGLDSELDSDMYWRSDADPETYSSRPLFPLFSKEFVANVQRDAAAQANHIVLLNADE
eukprot:1525097-Rhodomonas_salina.4